MKKHRKHRKSPKYQPPVHYLVKAGFSRPQALGLLRGALPNTNPTPKKPITRGNFPGSISPMEYKEPSLEERLTATKQHATRSAGVADGLRDALRIVVSKGC